MCRFRQKRKALDEVDDFEVRFASIIMSLKLLMQIAWLGRDCCVVQPFGTCSKY